MVQNTHAQAFYIKKNQQKQTVVTGVANNKERKLGLTVDNEVQFL
jgi:hypothetical protein